VEEALIHRSPPYHSGISDDAVIIALLHPMRRCRLAPRHGAPIRVRRREPVQRRDERLDVGSAFSWMTSDADVCRTNAAARRPWPRIDQKARRLARELGESSARASADAEGRRRDDLGTALMMSVRTAHRRPLCCWTVHDFFHHVPLGADDHLDSRFQTFSMNTIIRFSSGRRQ